MAKKLSEMTDEERWHLFPIILEKPNPEWENWFIEEKAHLEGIIPDEYIARLSHIGSTSVGTIWAKPTVDILIEIKDGISLSIIKDLILKSDEYYCMSEDEEWIAMNKGYTEQGFADKVYHIHLHHVGNNNELYFRDYLIDHPEAAKEYETLKLGIWKQYKYNRDKYTKAKTEVVRKYTELSKKAYPGRYA